MTRLANLSARAKLVWLLLAAKALALLCVALAVVVYEATTFRSRAIQQLNNQAAVLEEVTRALAEDPVVRILADAFSDAGFDLAVVGGPVRDALLGRATHDLDFTTDARPDDILRIVAPIATAHWDIGREFGTIGARIQLAELDYVCSSKAAMTSLAENYVGLPF